MSPGADRPSPSPSDATDGVALINATERIPVDYDLYSVVIVVVVLVVVP